MTSYQEENRNSKMPPDTTRIFKLVKQRSQSTDLVSDLSYMGTQWLLTVNTEAAVYNIV